AALGEGADAPASAADADLRPPGPRAIAEAAARVRAAASASLAPHCFAAALKATLALWRERGFERRSRAIGRIAAHTGFSLPLLEESLDALMSPFTDSALDSLAAAIGDGATRRSVAPVIAFVMAGNVTGAGMHEVVAALVGGAGAVLKSASGEPVFWAEFARTIRDIDAEVGARVAVFNWPRAAVESTAALRANCDLLVAYGDDATVASFARHPRVIAFGSRVSGAAISESVSALPDMDGIADALARDVTLFEQLGCLSPHHVFVQEPSHGSRAGTARDFAARLAAALDHLAVRLPPPAKLPLNDAASVLHAREIARWRRIGGESVDLFEGGRLGWTVICDAAAGFTVSPGFRTVCVSAFRDDADFRARVAPAAGRLEAFAVAGSADERARLGEILHEFGVTYLAAPGEMQSPPLTWRHGGGAFLDLLTGTPR
ncbi:MAG TPA: acyl-CoA reductase, partial [Candidatus Binataceae bacterium]